MAKRIALVTGGMGGIGQAICTALHDQGLRVVAAYSRKIEDAISWQQKQEKNGYHFDIAYGDVSNFQSCETMVKKVENDVGPVDVLINNAGITRDHSCCKMTQEDWDKVIGIDLNSVFYVTHAVIHGMKERKYGRIINISSVNGQKGQYGQVNYAAAKAGMHGFTKSLAMEVARCGITVNTVSPGYIATEMIVELPEPVREKILADIPMHRFGEPHEIARLVAFLADEKNSYMTGANIAINGGHYML